MKQQKKMQKLEKRRAWFDTRIKENTEFAKLVTNGAVTRPGSVKKS